MNHEICREFIHHLDQDGSLECGHAPEHIQRWLEELNLPVGFLTFMRWDWPQADGQIAHLTVRSSRSIYADDATVVLIAHKLLNIGSAPNGDWLVIDFSTEACGVGFVTHEEWSPWSDSPQDPRLFLQPIARSFASFLYRAVEGRYLPTDYYAARKFNSFLMEERRAGG